MPTAPRRLPAAIVVAAGMWANAGSAGIGAAVDPVADGVRLLGAGAVDTLRIEARGADFLFGQAYDGSSPWPRFNVPRYVLSIDYRIPAFREERTRTQAQNPPLGGGNQPIPEQRQVWSLHRDLAWNGDGDRAAAAGRERDQRSAADARQTFLSMTPHGFLKAALAAHAPVTTVGGEAAVKHIVSVITPAGVRLVGTLDAAGRVERIETRVPTPVIGDAFLEATFHDYRAFGAVTFPSRMVYREGGYPILDLTVTGVTANPVVDLAPPSRVASAPPAAPLTAVPVQLAGHVWRIGLGPRDCSVLVEFADHVVIIEAPDGEEASLAAIAAVHRVVPGKPIRYVINTHTHFDHSGGLRTYAAEGATILTHADNAAYYRQVWANPRTIAPDRLAKSGRSASIEGIVGARTLSDDVQTLVVYHYAGNMHNPGMLMVHLPRERILVEADSFNPPADPGEPPNAMPNLVQFYGVVRRLALDVERIVPLHGRVTTLAEAERAVDAYKDFQLWPAAATETLR